MKTTVLLILFGNFVAFDIVCQLVSWEMLISGSAEFQCPLKFSKLLLHPNLILSSTYKIVSGYLSLDLFSIIKWKNGGKVNILEHKRSWFILKLNECYLLGEYEVINNDFFQGHRGSLRDHWGDCSTWLPWWKWTIQHCRSLIMLRMLQMVWVIWERDVKSWLLM